MPQSATPPSQSSQTPSPHKQYAIAKQLAVLQAKKQKNSPPASQSVSSLKPQQSRKPHFAWTGFTDKTLWDWLDFLVKLLGALAIPLVVVLASNALTTQQQQTTNIQHKNEVAIENDQQKEAMLKAYLDDMTSLLLSNKLRTSSPTDEVRNIARVKTLITVHQLDSTRKTILLQFLYEAGLIDQPKPIVDLTGADLSMIKLSGTNLKNVDLAGADLNNIDLNGADLSFAHLGKTDLDGANLSNTILLGADLSNTILFGADLRNAELAEANLSGSLLRRAGLSGADLSGADLSGASLENTIMPNGSTLSNDSTYP